jgi:type II secretory pathway component PulL
MAKSDQVGEELRLLYTAILEDIQLIKKQQLQVTNYVVGIFITILYYMVNQSGNNLVRIILFLVSLVVAVFGFLFIHRLENDLKRSREQKTRTIESFSPQFKAALYGNNKKEKESPSIKIILYTIIAFGVLAH